MAENYKNYSQVKQRLDDIVDKVTDENISLDEALDLYDEAVKLATRASDLIEVETEIDAQDDDDDTQTSTKDDVQTDVSIQGDSADDSTRNGDVGNSSKDDSTEPKLNINNETEGN